MKSEGTAMHTTPTIIKRICFGVAVIVLASYGILRVPIAVGHGPEQQAADAELAGPEFPPTASANHPPHLLD